MNLLHLFQQRFQKKAFFFILLFVFSSTLVFFNLLFHKKDKKDLSDYFFIKDQIEHFHRASTTEKKDLIGELSSCLKEFPYVEPLYKNTLFHEQLKNKEPCCSFKIEEYLSPLLPTSFDSFTKLWTVFSENTFHLNNKKEINQEHFVLHHQSCLEKAFDLQKKLQESTEESDQILANFNQLQIAFLKAKIESPDEKAKIWNQYLHQQKKSPFPITDHLHLGTIDFAEYIKYKGLQEVDEK